MEIMKKNNSELEKLELAYWAQKYAKQLGADDSAIAINKRRSISVKYRDGKVDKLKESSQNSLRVEIYSGGKYSSHFTNDLRKSSLEKFLENAIGITRYLEEDPYKALPDPALYRGRPKIDLQLFDNYYYGLDIEDRIEKARQLYELIRDRDPRIISITADFRDSHYESTHLKSNGFEGKNEGSSFNLGAEVSLRGREDRKPNGWRYYRTRHIEDLPAANVIAKKALKRAQDAVGRRKVESATVPMIVENITAPGLLWRLFRAMSGYALQQKQSYLEGQLNTQIASKRLTMIDNPTIVRGLGSRYYDGDGIAAKSIPVIEEGVLKNYYIDVYYGRKLKMNPTTGGASNIVFKLGKRNGMEIEKDLDRAILVTGFIGGNANSTTGDFSLGIVGWLIENGERTVPLNEMNISGNFTDLLNNLVEVGNDPFELSSMRTPTLLFDGVEFSGL